MRVLLTGANGFIGSHVARHLVQRGDLVTAVVSPAGGDERIAAIGVAEVVPLDLTCADLGDLVHTSSPELCIHLAWYVEPGRYLGAVPENLAGLVAGVRLLAALDSAGCPRAVLAGTCLERADASSPYASAKAALHSVSGQLKTTRVACAHIFHLYGPGERRERVVPTVARACLRGKPVRVTDGEQELDYLHVDDVAAALTAIATSSATGRIDVCSGRPTQLREVFAAIGRATGRSELIRLGALPREGEPQVDPGDPSGLVALGWSPRWSLDEGISQTVAWWRESLEREGSIT